MQCVGGSVCSVGVCSVWVGMCAVCRWGCVQCVGRDVCSVWVGVCAVCGCVCVQCVCGWECVCDHMYMFL